MKANLFHHSLFVSTSQSTGQTGDVVLMPARDSRECHRHVIDIDGGIVTQNPSVQPSTAMLCLTNSAPV
jgi:hypothetical protein